MKILLTRHVHNSNWKIFHSDLHHPSITAVCYSCLNRASAPLKMLSMLQNVPKISHVSKSHHLHRITCIYVENCTFIDPGCVCDLIIMHYLAKIPGLLHTKYIEIPLHLILANSACQLNFGINQICDHPATADQHFGFCEPH